MRMGAGLAPLPLLLDIGLEPVLPKLFLPRPATVPIALQAELLGAMPSAFAICSA